jgi:hypothetical protein
MRTGSGSRPQPDYFDGKMNLMVSQTYEHLRKCPVTKNVKTVFMDDMNRVPFGTFELRGGRCLSQVMTLSVFENKLVERIFGAKEENKQEDGEKFTMKNYINYVLYNIIT